MMLNVITSNYITPVRKNVQLVESQQWQDHAQLHAHGRTMHTHGANRFLLTACMDVLEKLVTFIIAAYGIIFVYFWSYFFVQCTA